MNSIRFNILLKAINEGNDSALKEVYGYYLPKIIMHVKTKFPTVSPDDVAQDFFFWLTSAKSLPYVRYPTSWVYAVCDNYAKKYLFKEVLVDQLEITGDVDYYENEIVSGVAHEMLYSLDDDISRKVMYLYYWKGYNLREISDLLHENKSTIKQKHARAIKKLRKKIKKL